jgi:hypothetical protein
LSDQAQFHHNVPSSHFSLLRFSVVSKFARSYVFIQSCWHLPTLHTMSLCNFLHPDVLCTHGALCLSTCLMRLSLSGMSQRSIILKTIGIPLHSSSDIGLHMDQIAIRTRLHAGGVIT